MDFLGEVMAWYTDPANWSGRDAIGLRIGEHVWLSATSLAAGLLLALPAGLYIGHTNRGARAVVAISNIGRAVPSLGWLGIVYPITTLLFARAGIGFLPAFAALVALAIPPIVTNTYAGLREVDDDLREAGRGMGMTELQLLRRVEVPVALPVILAGVRSSAVTVVATATLAALVGGGTLGHFIVQGLFLNDQVRVFGAAVLVALLALGTEAAFALLQRRAMSPGLRGAHQRAPGEAVEVAPPATT
ncbi:MAG TPA: ABC transporter permease [Candidatus Limnocylindria bacterium]|jgi:osmoprotectant transport system permease protein